MRLGQIAAFGIYLQRQLVLKGFPKERIIEVYPGASWKVTHKGIGGQLSKARDGNSKAERARAQRALAASLQNHVRASGEELMKHGLDGLDSVMCALTAYWHTRGETERLGDDDGWVIVPKARW